eukprot:TRINITY_DN9381_c0_g1_i3.p2 TRINITY_DN9381_c0_g1~~TRINITY_DN9381_c0_g1_i3.p2  ORF type:complete len:125 (-),score=28.41 TRINITY_DN9381_c0_g1_i3:178-552(-)
MQDTAAKKGIRRKVEIPSGTDTPTYLRLLDSNLKAAAAEFSPQLLVYNAGTDVLEGDPLGRLKVSAEGVAQRDEMVFAYAREAKIPILMLTSGGYQKNNAKVIADSIANLNAMKLISLSETTGS